MNMNRFKLILEYNGANLIGWQINKDGPSVQSLVTDAILEFSGARTEVVAAGRTDAGVHAIGMVAHFDLERDWDANTVCKALNFYLAARPVAVLSCIAVDDEFHARFSCKRRNYQYKILNRTAPAVLDRGLVWWMPRPLDIGKMRAAAARLIGNHDFTSFRASECQAASPVKTLDKIDITTDGDYVLIDVSAQSFLHHMVRNIVGTLVQIGIGRDMDIDAVLAACDRSAAGPTAPAAGLYFVSAEY